MITQWEFDFYERQYKSMARELTRLVKLRDNSKFSPKVARLANKAVQAIVSAMAEHRIETNRRVGYGAMARARGSR